MFILPFQLRSRIRLSGEAEERDEGIDSDAEGVAERAQEEPLPHEGREDHARHHHEDDPHPGVHVVRQRQAEAQEGEQDDLGAQEQDGRRRRQRPLRLRRQGQGRHGGRQDENVQR
ncbi:hypothetical protein AAG570_012160 [Ranatra chinensis]|uniref:Uncharacterized protein n=1 Tax=Ranatra chinensis TaxID=642074 RepID=A0ABD0Z6B2_9HEMI